VLNSLGGIKLGNARVFLMGESWEVPGMCTEYSGHFVTEYSSAEGTTVMSIHRVRIETICWS
jgi:hypothetical protein